MGGGSRDEDQLGNGLLLALVLRFAVVVVRSGSVFGVSGVF